ncbi:MAG TPA: hypothetical protein GX011_06275 [Clostridiales bacterium]|jgi:hypothetical protein|nr:hypothetical protein [Clostridiales bacterium]
MHNVNIDFSKTIGKIKPLHGLNAGPRNGPHGVYNMDTYKAAGIPIARLHDILYPYGAGHYVDIPCIFPNFDADPDCPESYDFKLTDDYLKNIDDCGTRILYRLGVSIEHFSKKYHIYPPKDYQKWAKICAGIVRHYTEGWADGFYYKGMMWEIWNEPEGRKNMWIGTDEEYYELYVVTANYLKSQFPDIIVGGPAATKCNDFLRGFLAYITKDGKRAPLDFFSYHRYTADPAEVARQTRIARDWLDEFGYTETLNVIDEWNYVISWAEQDVTKSYRVIESQKGAAYCAAVLCLLQDSPVDISVYYGAEVHQPWSGFFNRYAQPLKMYYTAYAFNQLYMLGDEAEVSGLFEGLYCIAACGKAGGGVLLTNFNTPLREVSLTLTGADGRMAEIHLLDEDHNLEKISEVPADSPIMLSLPEDSVVWLRVV